MFTAGYDGKVAVWEFFEKAGGKSVVVNLALFMIKHSRRRISPLSINMNTFHTLIRKLKKLEERSYAYFLILFLELKGEVISMQQVLLVVYMFTSCITKESQNTLPL